MNRVTKSAKRADTTGNCGWQIQPFWPLLDRPIVSSTMRGVKLTQHYCRGCGKPLLVSWRGLFHPDCLRADKRYRTREKRRHERERFEAWLKRRRCHECGAKLGVKPQDGLRPAQERLGETSQRHPEPRKVAGIGKGSPEQLAPRSGENSPLEASRAG